MCINFYNSAVCEIVIDRFLILLLDIVLYYVKIIFGYRKRENRTTKACVHKMLIYAFVVRNPESIQIDLRRKK